MGPSLPYLIIWHQDITPPVVAAWLRHPIVRVHILLDPRGKTCSHAYVELSTEEIARAALRSVQNSVLGRGKRARGVTVTLSNQTELMHAVCLLCWRMMGASTLPASCSHRGKVIGMVLDPPSPGCETSHRV